MNKLTSLAIGLCISLPLNAAELLYFYDTFCGACQKFEEEVGYLYEKTEEAKSLPMRKIEFSSWRKNEQGEYRDIIAKRIVGTPTFVLIDNNTEIDRLVGYSNDELFWLNLTAMRHKLD